MGKNLNNYSRMVLLSCCLVVSANSWALDQQPSNSDRVISLPGYIKPLPEQYSGYLTIIHNNEAQFMYYYLVIADNDTKSTPLILWLNGGPGSSSFYGFFTENGPYTLTDDLKLHDNPFAWMHKFNYLVFDQPLGVGYSVASKNYRLKSQAQATHELYLALQGIYKNIPICVSTSFISLENPMLEDIYLKSQ